jgi:hypothetical protein
MSKPCFIGLAWLCGVTGVLAVLAAVGVFGIQGLTSGKSVMESLNRHYPEPMLQLWVMIVFVVSTGLCALFVSLSRNPSTRSNTDQFGNRQR